MVSAHEVKDQIIRVRLDKDCVAALVSHAKIENITVSEYIRNSISWYISKDVNYKSQLEATIENLRNEQRKCLKELELFSSLFKYWTRYYFTLTQGLEDMPDEAKLIRIDKGKRQTESLLKSFRRELKEEKPGIIEALVADYLVQPEEK